MGMLQVVTGLVFVLLLLSLFATTVMELLASALSLRGKNLEKALENMLVTHDNKKTTTDNSGGTVVPDANIPSGYDDTVLKEFKNNPLYKQLSFKYGKKRNAPSYVSSESFRSILMAIILKGKNFDWDNVKAQINEISNQELKEVLLQFANEAEDDLDSFKSKISTWYNNVMDRASGWYKRSTQKILVVVGLAIAVIFNADTLAIYERLESDPAALQEVVQLADSFVAANDSLTINQIDPQFQQSYDQLKDILNNQISNIKSPLGLGWKNVDFSKLSPYDWLTKILGYIVTALAISLGAPFWFDLLRKIVNLRQSGGKPAE